jgi:replicative DNA helicase
LRDGEESKKEEGRIKKGNGNGLETAGGVAYIAGLPDEVPRAANLEYYLEIVRGKFLRREVLKVASVMVSEVYEEGTKAEEVVARAERSILGLSESGSEATESSVKEVLRDVITDLEEYHRGHAQVEGLTTGLAYLDKVLCGIGGKNEQRYYVISGRPSTGKSALAMQIAEHVALDHVWFKPVLDEKGQAVMEVGEDGEERPKMTSGRGLPVGVFSLEMTKKGLVKRVLFRRAGADLQRFRTGFANKGDFERLTSVVGQVAGAKIHIEDSNAFLWESVRAKARRFKRQYGSALFVIDYIQLMGSGERQFREDRVRELSMISTGIVRLAKQLDTPVIVVAQMNRDFDKEPNRAPRLSDLKDCGQIEQDADVIGFLYEPKLKDEAAAKYEGAMAKVYGEDWSKYPKRVNLLIAKQRNGPTDNVQLLFQKSCTSFLDYGEWLKEHGEAAPAKGEEGRYKDRELPTNEELGL